MELIIVRHGRPEHVETDGAPADPDLSDIGREQAECTADLLVDAGIDVIVSSPLRRAVQTAAPLVDRLDLTPLIVDGLTEYDRDDTRYVPAEVMRELDPDSFYVDPRDEMGDDVHRFTEAVTTSFRALIADNPGRRVAAYCHGMVTAVWFAHVLGLDHGPTQFIPDYCGVSRFLASPAHDTITIRSFNEVGHLGDTFIPLF